MKWTSKFNSFVVKMLKLVLCLSLLVLQAEQHMEVHNFSHLLIFSIGYIGNLFETNKIMKKHT